MKVERSSEIYLNDYDYSKYTEIDKIAWKKLFQKQINVLEGKACREFLKGIDRLKDIFSEFPNLLVLSAEIERILGWKIFPVTGLINHQEYFQLLSNKYFPVAIFIRDSNDFDYAPLPDMWHDIFGHLPFFFSPTYQNFVAYLSRRMLTVDEEMRKKLGSLYWYTIEAGVCWENGQRRIYGASQVSSFSEIVYAVSDRPTVLPFDLEKILNLEVNNEQMQAVLFEIPAFEYLKQIEVELEAYLEKESRQKDLAA